MHVSSLRVANLRCLERARIDPGPGTNLVIGANGSGKTSLLEAISLVAYGRSFQSSRAADLVRYGQPGMSVRAERVDGQGRISEIVLRREGAETRISLDGQVVMAASVLAQHLPVMVFTSRASDLLTESPSNRRALLDRTMFHVEPGYGEIWKRYRTVLRQRNELVRRERRSELAFWDQQFANLCREIDHARRRVVAVINAALQEGPLLPRVGSLSFSYHPGWADGTILEQQLEGAWHRDTAAGFTTLGCHRADFALKCEGRAVGRRLSRGQGKFVVCAVVCALTRFIHRERGIRPILLVDDLSAELDDMMRGRAVDMITAIGGQSIFTAIKPRDLPEVSETTPHVFHVEQAADPPGS